MRSLPWAEDESKLTAPLCSSGGGPLPFSSAFTPDQSNALAQLVLNTHQQVVHLWEMFFALHCLLLGVLIFRSGFVPKVLGPMMVLAGLGYLANGLGNLLHPQSKASLAGVVAVTAIFGELPFFLWLLIKAVDAEAWQKLAGASGDDRRESALGGL